MDDPSTTGARFVARRHGTWWRCSLGSDLPIEIGLEEAIAGLRLDPGPATTDDAPRPAVELREIPAWIGSVGPGGVAIESVEGEPLLLGERDLRLLDAVGRAPSSTHVAEQLAWAHAEVIARADRLAAAGRMVIAPASEAPAAPPSPAEPVEVIEDEPIAPRPAPRRSLLDRVRGRGRQRPDASIEHASCAPEAPAASAASEVSELDHPPTLEVDPDLARHPDDPGSADRIPVYAVWHRHVGPLLSLGMLTAAARHHRDGSLTETYEIRRPESAESVLADLARRRGPAVLLLSDYVWSVEENLALARRAIACNPDLLVVHGGPSCPKYADDAEAFLAAHGDVAHLLVRGEGEEAICEILETVAPAPDRPQHLDRDPDRWAAIGGVTFRHPDGTVVRTPERDRIVDLDALPSPYLTGEFDHIEASAWNYCLSVETTRGCPYSCTFCDWGSDTMSRIRRFDLDRVTAEVRWVAERGVAAINIPDANFGISKRDVETTRRIAAAKAETGWPQVMVFYPAKNTTKHLTAIMDILGAAGISSAASLSLQTTDEASLRALDRANISTEHFVALAADYRRRSHPLQGDLLIGIPGQTYESYRRDLQFMFDHEILVRTWPVQLLPNAPMNEPGYRAEHGIVADEDRLVIAANSFDEHERRRMIRLRRIDIIVERLGVLRHVLRWLQWDHGIEATAVMDRINQVTSEDPASYPLLAITVDHFDLLPVPAVGWRALYDEVHRFIVEQLGVDDADVLDDLLAMQRALMPQPGRAFPHVTELAHDFVEYYRAAVVTLYTDGRAGGPERPLRSYGPGTLTVEDDPLELCTHGLQPAGDPRSETMQGDFLIGSSVANELRSPLMRLLPLVGAHGLRPTLFEGDLERFRPEPAPAGSLPVRISLRSSARADALATDGSGSP